MERTPFESLLETQDAEENLRLGIAFDLRGALRQAEVKILRVALGQSRGNVSLAARLLGMNRTTFHEKIKRYGI